MVVPNFFIVGAAKSGTTSLVSYLMQHPDVYMPGIWEFHQLSDDLLRVRAEAPLPEAEYLKYFEPGAGRKRIGEKSVLYMYSRSAPKNIRKLNPDARLICILRDPVEVAWSFYKYNLANLQEVHDSFEDALEAEAERALGRKIPDTADFVDSLLYRQVPKFADQLEQLYSNFDREQVLVLFFDDLRKRPDEVYGHMLRFLGLAPMTLSEYTIANQSDGLATLEVRRAFQRHPALEKIGRRVLPQSLRKVARSAYIRLRGGVPKHLQRMRPETRRMLCREFQPQVRRVEELTSRDLSAWCVEP